MISVLMPSRERSKLAKESIESLGEEDSQFEVLLYIDEDEPQMDDYLALVGFNVQLYIGTRHGYGNFHKMINYLAKRAKGDWLLLWNDDAIMLSQDWASKINKIDSSKPVVLNFFDAMNKQNNLFPAISRPMYKAMGHFSLNTHCDSWVQDIANELGIHKPVGAINCIHRRELLSDVTKVNTQATYKITSPAYNLMTKERAIDKRKIKELL